jgi:tRNA U34 5-methylaminomethyl-2-thiouridine-forming methyltransferase MnmC
MYFCRVKKELKITADGSKTIYVPAMDEQYHSGHGALQEALHVFIEQGIRLANHPEELHIFEMGFGTGLNAFLSLIEAESTHRNINYVGIEAYPIDTKLVSKLEYEKLVDLNYESLFFQLHDCPWETPNQLTTFFSVQKIQAKIEEYNVIPESFDVVFYDAFGPRAQQSMWHIDILSKMYQLLKKDGFLVTYCAKGQVKRDLKSLGFEVVTLPGPPGKREMIKALKK